MYLIKYKETEVGEVCCFPYVFNTKEEAQRYIDENTYFPSEFEVISAIQMSEHYDAFDEIEYNQQTLKEWMED